jgi:hypothetical protein
LNTRSLAHKSAAEQESIAAALAAAVAFLKDRQHELTRATSHGDYTWALRAAEMMEPVFNMLRIWPEHTPSVEAPPPPEVMAELLKTVIVRDKEMARNLLFLLDRAGPNARGLMFAANGHVMAHIEPRELMVHEPAATAVAGFHMRAALGAAYVIIIGTCAAPPPGAYFRSSGEIDALLHATGKSDIVVDFRTAPAHAWFDTPRDTWGMHCKPGVSFDAAALFRRLTPVSP